MKVDDDVIDWHPYESTWFGNDGRAENNLPGDYWGRSTHNCGDPRKTGQAGRPLRLVFKSDKSEKEEVKKDKKDESDRQASVLPKYRLF